MGSSWIRDKTCVPYIGGQILNLWTARDVPEWLLLAFMELMLWQRKKVFFYFEDLCVCGPFLKSFLNLLQYCFCWFFFKFFRWKACGILALQPGMEPTPLALRDFKFWAVREDPGQTDFSVYVMVTFPKAEGNQFSR